VGGGIIALTPFPPLPEGEGEYVEFALAPWERASNQ